MQEEVQHLLERVVSLKQIIEQRDDTSQKYQWLSKALMRIAFALQQCPVDIPTLRKETFGIFRVLDGPLHNEIENLAFELVGDIGLLEEKLEN